MDFDDKRISWKMKCFLSNAFEFFSCTTVIYILKICFTWQDVTMTYKFTDVKLKIFINSIFSSDFCGIYWHSRTQKPEHSKWVSTFLSRSDMIIISILNHFINHFWLAYQQLYILLLKFFSKFSIKLHVL